MDLHLFATDVSALRLAESLPAEDRFVCLIVPGNRAGSEKVRRLRAAAGGLPVYEHHRSQPLPGGTPGAEGAVSWLYSQIIRPEDIARYRLGILNMHGGKLPEYRGAHVLQWVIINGETEMGVTWHGVVDEVDAGPIWAESTIPVPPGATALDMRAAMIAEGTRLFPEAWSRMRLGVEPLRLPDLSEGRVWRARKPVDGLIGPGWPERRVRDTVRALCPPWPPALIGTEAGQRPVSRVLDSPAEGAVRYVTAESRVVYLA